MHFIHQKYYVDGEMTNTKMNQIKMYRLIITDDFFTVLK